jgi:hypothetical protein
VALPLTEKKVFDSNIDEVEIGGSVVITREMIEGAATKFIKVVSDRLPNNTFGRNVAFHVAFYLCGPLSAMEKVLEMVSKDTSLKSAGGGKKSLESYGQKILIWLEDGCIHVEAHSSK